MKKIVLIAVLFTGTQYISNCCLAQQIYVKVRPVAPVVARPVATKSGNTWIQPEWVWRGGRYVYVNGFWAPPRIGYHYVSGYWMHRRRGDVWIIGGWKK